MLILKHLKALQHVSIIIQIIFRELVGSMLKSQKSISIILNFKNFKFSDFNKEPTSSLKMIRIIIETCWPAF